MDLRSILHCALALGLIAGLSTPAPGGEAKKAAKKEAKAAEKKAAKKGEVVADAETTALLDKTRKLTYYPTAEGLKKASAKGEAKATLPGQPPAASAFTYQFDGTVTPRLDKFTYDDPAKVRQAVTMLPTVGMLLYDKEPWREEYAGCKLATSQEGGKTVIKVVEGKSKQGMTKMVLNADGMPEEITGNAPGMPGKKDGAVMVMKVKYAKIGEKFAPSSITAMMNGATVMEQTAELAPVGKFHLPKKIAATANMMGMKMESDVTFEEWKVNDEAVLTGEKAEEKKAAKPAKAAKKAAKAPTG